MEYDVKQWLAHFESSIHKYDILKQFLMLLFIYL